MKLSIIVACDLNGTIGNKGRIPWHLPSDLKRFRRLTMGKPCIMGRKTFESLGQPLDGRINIVLSRQADYQPPGCHGVNAFADAIKFAEATGVDETMVIGGAEVYREALPLADRVHNTMVVGDFEGDTVFPFDAVKQEDWLVTFSKHQPPDADNRYAHWFFTNERVRPA